MPMIGICLGLENFAIWTADEGESVLEEFKQHYQSIPLEFVDNQKSSIMYRDLSKKDKRDFETMNLTYNSHDFALAPEKFKSDNGMKEFWEITSLSSVTNGTKYVSSFQAQTLPIVALQFHPEKSTQAYNSTIHNNRSWRSQKLQEVFAEKFV